MFLQQDGVSVHNLVIVKNHLNNVFGNQCMITYDPIEWLLRSQDLTPKISLSKPFENGCLC